MDKEINMFKKKPEVHKHTHGKKVVNINKTITHGEKKVTVKEHKAPTDESLRLLDEMQKKAQDRILEKHYVKLGDNEFGGLVLKMQMDDYSRDTHYCVLFKLHGKEYKFFYEDDGFAATEHELKLLVRGVSEAIQQQVHVELTKAFIRR
jgi:hypothetical protein